MFQYPVEQGPGIRHTLIVTFHRPVIDLGQNVALVTVGTKPVTTIWLQRDGTDEIRFVLTDPLDSVTGTPMRIVPSHAYRIDIITDPNIRSVTVSSQQTNLLTGILSSIGPGVVHPSPSSSGSPSPMSVVDATGPAPTMSLCRSLP
jgi:hypothetical protein